MHLNYCTFLRIIKSSQCDKMSYKWNDAIRAIENSECEDQIRIAIAVGIAIGKHQERERRKPKKSIIDAIEDQWQDDGSAMGAMNHIRKGAYYKKASRAVVKVYGNDDILAMAASEVGDAAFRAGFGRALEMFAEAKRILEERQ